MKTYTTSIFVELEIRVSGTLPSTDPSGWKDVTVEGIVSHQPRMLGGQMCRRRRELLTSAGFVAELLDNLAAEFSEEIEFVLDAEVPDGPDPDDARDARIDEELRG